MSNSKVETVDSYTGTWEDRASSFLVDYMNNYEQSALVIMDILLSMANNAEVVNRDENTKELYRLIEESEILPYENPLPPNKPWNRNAIRSAA